MLNIKLVLIQLCKIKNNQKSTLYDTSHELTCNNNHGEQPDETRDLLHDLAPNRDVTTSQNWQ